jgi:hypothetical protein
LSKVAGDQNKQICPDESGTRSSSPGRPLKSTATLPADPTHNLPSVDYRTNHKAEYFFRRWRIPIVPRPPPTLHALPIARIRKTGGYCLRINGEANSGPNEDPE